MRPMQATCKDRGHALRLSPEGAPRHPVPCPLSQKHPLSLRARHGTRKYAQRSLALPASARRTPGQVPISASGKRLCSGRGGRHSGTYSPGDRKPPLCIYFSGYRTREGFEGLNMMSKLSCPFLLFQDPRIEGGCFYLGDADYEGNIVSVIRQAADSLHFRDEQMIFSGISMGSTGALYYASFFPSRRCAFGEAFDQHRTDCLQRADHPPRGDFPRPSMQCCT